MEADRFYRNMLKTFKTEKDPESRQEKIAADFENSLPVLPENMASDLFWDIAELFRLKEAESREDFEEAVDNAHQDRGAF